MLTPGFCQDPCKHYLAIWWQRHIVCKHFFPELLHKLKHSGVQRATSYRQSFSFTELVLGETTKLLDAPYHLKFPLIWLIPYTDIPVNTYTHLWNSHNCHPRDSVWCHMPKRRCSAIWNIRGRGRQNSTVNLKAFRHAYIWPPYNAMQQYKMFKLSASGPNSCSHSPLINRLTTDRRLDAGLTVDRTSPQVQLIDISHRLPLDPLLKGLVKMQGRKNVRNETSAAYQSEKVRQYLQISK